MKGGRMKTCSTCRRSLPPDEFNRRSRSADGLQAVCRPCNAARARRYYADNLAKHRSAVTAQVAKTRAAHLERIGEYLLAHPCVDCGETDIRVLDFDHRDGADKSAEVMKLAKAAYSWQRVRAEMEDRIKRAAEDARADSEDRVRRLADRVAREAEARARAEAEAALSQESVRLQREADERVEEARRRADQEVREKVDKVRRDALSGTGEAADPDETPDKAPPGESSSTRHVGGRRLRTY